MKTKFFAHNKHRTISLPIAGIMMVGAVLSACGSSSGSSTATTAASGTTAAPATTAASGTTAAPSTTATPNYGTLTFAQVGPDAGKWAMYAAETLGYFKKVGISSISMTTTSSSPRGVQDVMSNAVEIAEIGNTDAISAVAGGGSVVIVAGEENLPPYTINVAKGITSFSQLKGQKVTVAAPTNITKLYWDAVAKGEGFASSDFTYIYSPTTGGRFAALKGGVVKAAMLLPPATFEAESLGLNSLANVSKYVQYPFTSFAVNPTWAKAHSAELVAFLKAYLEGVQWLYNPANKAQALQILMKATNATQTIASQSYTFFLQPGMLPKDGTIPTSEMTAEAQAMVGLGAFKSPPATSSFMDMSYVQQAASELGISG